MTPLSRADRLMGADRLMARLRALIRAGRVDDQVILRVLTAVRDLRAQAWGRKEWEKR